MQKKYFKFMPKGIVMDLQEELQNNQYATEIRNLRLTTIGDNTNLALTSEIGNTKLSIRDSSGRVKPIKGIPVGTCVLNNKLIVFAVTQGASYNLTHIYQFAFQNNGLIMDLLYSGNLNMKTNNPIETLAVYENNLVQKIYWVDGVNQPRCINIVNVRNVSVSSTKIDTQFDFVPELKLEENVIISRINGNGEFPSGVLQYAFSYYNKYGQQSNIAYQSNLIYLGNENGVAPDDKINSAYKITIQNPDNFDYVRLYSIIRTTKDTTPIVKVVTDIKIDNTDSIDIVDNGLIGYTIDPKELLYIGGETLYPYTIETKDNVLFLGNYRIQNLVISGDIDTYIRSYIRNYNDINNPIIQFKPYLYNNDTQDYYDYKGILDNQGIAGFKYLEWYRIGLQFQHKCGKYSEPIYIGDYQCDAAPLMSDISQTVAKLKFTLPDELKNYIKQTLPDYLKYRIVIVEPTNNYKSVLCQGIVSSTMFNLQDRINNNPFGISPWRMVPLGRHMLNIYDTIDSRNNEIQNVSEPLENATINRATQSKQYTLYYWSNSGNNAFYFYYELKDGTNMISKYSGIHHNEDIAYTNATDNLKLYINESAIPSKTDWQSHRYDNKGNKAIESSILIYTERAAKHSNEFFVDDSIVELYSPDLMDIYNQINENTKFRLVGILQTQNLQGRYQIFGSSLMDSTKKGQIEGLDFTNICNAPLWEDVAYKGQESSWLFATYLWHREGSLNADKKPETDSGGTTTTQTSLLQKKIFSNVRQGTTTYFKDKEYFDYERLSPIKVHTDHSNTIYKLESFKDTDIEDDFYFQSDIDKVNTYPVRTLQGKQVGYPIYGIEKLITEGVDAVKNNLYNVVKDSNNNYIFSFDPVHIQYKTTPHAVMLLYDNSPLGFYGGYETLPYINDNFYNDGLYNDYYWWVKSKVNNQGIFQHTLKDETADSGSGTLVKGRQGLSDKNVSQFSNLTVDDNVFYIGELYNSKESLYESIDYKDGNDIKISNKTILSQYKWIPSSITASIDDYVLGNGDTYFQKWDCLKTVPNSPEDKNQYIDITSFYVESRINLDGRYDKQRGLKNNLGTTEENFNLINNVYSQNNNFFNYNILQNYDNIEYFPNQITITGEKINGSDIDNWTNVNFGAILDLDGTCGTLQKIKKYNNDLFCFQDKGFSQLLFNSRVQIPTSDNVPIQISNGAKLQDKVYISNNIGCQNKYTITESSNGLYFIDQYTGSFYRYTNKFDCISEGKVYKYINSLPLNKWTPADMNSVRTLYDRTLGDIYIDNSKKEQLCYTESLNEFQSFYDYNSVLFMETLNNRTLQISLYPQDENSDFSIWEMHSGQPNVLFNNVINYSVKFIINPDFEYNKMFSTIEFRGDDISNIGTLLSNHKHVGYTSDYYPFNILRTSNEYQESESTKKDLRKKFGVWRWDIGKNKRGVYNRDRIRNAWIQAELIKDNTKDTTQKRVKIYDINAAYYV